MKKFKTANPGKIKTIEYKFPEILIHGTRNQPIKEDHSWKDQNHRIVISKKTNTLNEKSINQEKTIYGSPD